MEVRELGSSGVIVPVIGTGVWRYNGGVEPLRRGIEAGAFLTDTGRLLRCCFRSSRVNRVARLSTYNFVTHPPR